MFEYKLMSYEELCNYLLEYWEDNVSAIELGDIYEEIKTNLKTLDGVERELDAVRSRFDLYSEEGYTEDSPQYQELDAVWNHLNWYKTDLQKKEEIKNGN